ncbi:MAG: hypothetical protein ACI9R3_004285 [Verrucomicrobiales bacterium]|jgi:hypothetical protein
MRSSLVLATLALLGLTPLQQASALTIVIDYTYDTQNFFDTTAKKDSLQAASDRFSQVITSSLTAVGPSGNGTTPANWRIGFDHPGTGFPVEVSTASSAASDPIGNGSSPKGFASDADFYGFAGLAADTWILYAGGHSMTDSGKGGTATGSNYSVTANDLNGPLHRGVISNTPGNTYNDIPAWGGSVAFDNDGDTTWHYDLNSAAPDLSTDFYTVALHEIGHALGLNVGFNQLTTDLTGSAYSGANTLAAYNADNGTSLTDLSIVSGGNYHWSEDAYESEIFSAGNPNLVGTVGTGVLQDSLMDPEGDFTPTIRRLELTNMDVAALQDLGWTVVPEPSTGLFLSLATGLFCGRRRRP